MPRIDAPTLAEHRAARERALLDAARRLLTEEPGRVPTLAEVGELAGLSRSSVYQYFASRDDLLSALVADSFPAWQRRFDAALAATEDPRGQILAFARVNLELVADGEHALARTLADHAPAREVAERSHDFHARLLDPVRDALARLGAADPEVSAELVNGVVLAASRLVERTGDLEGTYRATAAMLEPYLRSLR